LQRTITLIQTVTKIAHQCNCVNPKSGKETPSTVVSNWTNCGNAPTQAVSHQNGRLREIYKIVDLFAQLHTFNNQ